jgi:hypothetical protein
MELQENLTLNDKSTTSNGMRPAPPPPYTAVSKGVPGPARAENIPPRGPMHRPTRSQEEAMRARRAATGVPGRPRAPNGELNIFADPESPRKSGERRVRRNSDSSLMERSGKLLDPEEEKKRQERRRRGRRHREREREAGKDPKARKGRLDIIDQLDATSIYGTGREWPFLTYCDRANISVFHHDGPFDACNPHRNRAGSKRAPMQAFPKDSLNNIIGGGGPLNARPDHATFLGNNDEEAFKDYSRGGAGPSSYASYGSGAGKPNKHIEPVVVSAAQRIELVHGDESLGLGTSTFLEGAPASRNAIQRRETEEAIPEGNGIQRKKSLAQKFRGISNNRRDVGPSGRITSPEGISNATSPDLPTPNNRMSNTEKNPFFGEFEAKEEKLEVKKDFNKPENITIAEPEVKGERPRAPSSPRRGFGERLERRATSDATGEELPKTANFFTRVKSLKGKKQRPERPDKPV